jgi:hypothetical protein
MLLALILAVATWGNIPDICRTNFDAGEGFRCQTNAVWIVDGELAQVMMLVSEAAPVETVPAPQGFIPYEPSCDEIVGCPKAVAD